MNNHSKIFCLLAFTMVAGFAVSEPSAIDVVKLFKGRIANYHLLEEKKIESKGCAKEDNGFLCKVDYAFRGKIGKKDSFGYMALKIDKNAEGNWFVKSEKMLEGESPAEAELHEERKKSYNNFRAVFNH